MNYHILKQSSKKDTVEVVFHIPIPATNNFAIKTFQIALKERLTQNGVVISSIVPNIDSTELTQLQNGELLEVVENINFSANLTNVQKREIIRTRFSILSSEISVRIQDELRFWGFAENIV